MIDISKRRFTIRIGRSGKPLKNGEQLNKRASVVGRKTSTRRVSVRNSAAIRRAPSAAGGLHRGASVRRSQSGVRRGASVKRAPSASRRNSKRVSALITESTFQPAPAAQTTSTSDGAQPSTAEAIPPPVTSPISPASSKSFFSKLTSRFRGRSKAPKYQPEHPTPFPIPPVSAPPNGITATLAAGNLAPSAPPRSPSLRSPSPGSRVTFVDTPADPVKVADTIIEPNVDSNPDVPQAKTQAGDITTSAAIVEAEVIDGDEGEWVDAEDDDIDSEPRMTVDAKPELDASSSPAISAANQGVPPGSASREPQGTRVSTPAPGLIAANEEAKLYQASEVQPKSSEQPPQLQVSLLGDWSRDEAGDRISQWLAVTPIAVVDETEVNGQSESLASGVEAGSTTVTSKRESKQRPRPPQIVVPTLATNNPYRVPLPASPLPTGSTSNLADNNPYRPLVSNESGLLVETSAGEECIPPPSPSILLTPAHQFDDLDGLEFTRRSSDTLGVDGARVPLPPSPSPSSVSLLPEADDGSIVTSPRSDGASMARTSSMSTAGGRSLSTAPSTRGPATPKSVRFPGHPDMASFTFGGPSSPSLKVEDWEEGEERRGRSLEVNGSGKGRMRSKSPKLDSVLEGDENRRDSRASLEVTSPVEANDEPPLSPLPVVEETTTFGKKRDDDDSDSEHEDECGFYAFAEKQLVEEEKAESARLAAPKRSKTMSFLSAGFGKRKSAIGDIPPSPTSPTVPRSATSSRLLGLPSAGPKRSSTLMAPSGGNRTSRLLGTQRSSTLLADAGPQREALSPTMYTAGDIQAAAGAIEDEESRRLSEAAFMF